MFSIQKATIITAAVLTLCYGAIFTHAQTLAEERVDIVRATAMSATTPITSELPGLHKESQSQEITARIEDGPESGRVVTFTNDYVMLESGDVFYLKVMRDTHTDAEFLSVADPYRLDTLGWLTLVFLFVCMSVGRWQGFRGVVSLVAST